jgi:tRNA uridine 5-carbamoylmethylation protein Kti12
MSSSGQRPHFLRRNVDVIAATFIIAFAGIGTAVTSLVTSPSFPVERWVVQPAVQSVRPHVMQIREDIQREIAETRLHMKGDVCQMKNDIREAGRETAQFRQEIRRMRSEIRDEIRSWFRPSNWR